ncbi:MAG TPA: glutamine synthetase beta-grasp domain-containing protein, partial [Geobacterales bacterium]|nr:glutamine synthetase beta-grasp domain-containing protein [Geobacterales bacterium]
MQIETSKLEGFDYYMLWIVDFLGILRGRTIPNKFVRNALNEGLGFDGSSIIGYSTIDKSDFVMKADPSSFSPLPMYFYNKRVGKFFCDVLTNKGESFGRDPRNV